MVSAIERQILQSQVVDRIQQIQQRHPDMQQQYFETQLDQDRRKLAKRVNESDDIHYVKIGDEKGKKQQKDHPWDQESEEQTADGKALSEQKQHDHIDIKV